MSLGIFNKPIKMARPMRGLGQFNGLGGDWVWKGTESDPDVLALQKWCNVYLKKYGYYTIAEDGRLGPATCGAATYVINGFAGEIDMSTFPVTDAYLANMSKCAAWTNPTKIGATTASKTPSTVSADTYALPWGTYSGSTTAVQKNLNKFLPQYDVKTISEEGTLDAPTCGAMKYLDARAGSDWLLDYGKNCKAFTAPTSSKVAANTVVVPPPSTVVPPPSDSALVLGPTKNKTSTATMVTGGIVVAALAGSYYYAKKKGWF